MPIRRALLSVSDKTGLLDLARGLHALHIELLSTGGTAKLLRDAGIPVKEVAEHTGFPEILGGRVKTLHPKIHGGLLGRRGSDDAVMRAHGIEPIDLLAVNLYPFEATVVKPDCTLADAIENIDIGGPAMLRAAAKNHAAVTVLVDPADYMRVLEHLRAHAMTVSDALRYELASKAFAHTATYDSAIAMYLDAHQPDATPPRGLPDIYVSAYRKKSELRYGENPHQRAALYTASGDSAGTLAAARQLQGKALSYNNLADADAALACVTEFDLPACVIVKHANPCGVAVHAQQSIAYERAYATDPSSAFGGILAFNRPLDTITAEQVLAKQFVEVLLAPEIQADALKLLAAKPNVRVLVTGASQAGTRGFDCKRISGGMLLQEADTAKLNATELKPVTRKAPSAAELRDLRFAWTVAKYVKSNAVVYAANQHTLGIGAGQASRVMSVKIAALKAAEAGLALRGAVLASDAFFPFRDNVDAAAEAGIAAIIQPGGSMRDAEVIAAADEHGIAMVFTGVRHFRH